MADDAAKAPLVDETGVEMTEQQAPLRTADDGMDARDLIPMEDDAPAKIPDKVKMRGPNGEEEEVSLTPQLLFCFKDSNSAPPGGWYGPFGFLRMVAYAFVGIAFLGACFFLYGVLGIEEDGFSPVNIFTRALLVPAALLAAAAAYSHEGLANQVTLVSKRNDEYSKMNDDFESQLRDLEGVATKLDNLVASGQANLEKLTMVIDGIERISDLSKVNTIVRSFTDAEMREFLAAAQSADGESKAPSRRLSNVAELKAFLEGCVSVLKHNIPSFDMKSFRRFGLRGGVGLTIVSIMVAACNTENQPEQHCLVELLFFILDPHGEGRKEKVSKHLVKHLKDHRRFGSKAAIDSELDRLIATVDLNNPAHKSRVSEKEVTDLAQAVLTTVADAPMEDGNSLVVGEEGSDDE